MFDWRRFRNRSLRSGEPLDPYSDARPSTGRPRRREEDPDAERRARLRRRAFMFVVSGIFAAGGLTAVVGEEGFLEILRLRRDVRALEADIEARRADVSRLQSGIEGLKTDSSARERIARELLGLAPEGEIQFLLPREPAEESQAAPRDSGD